MLINHFFITQAEFPKSSQFSGIDLNNIDQLSSSSFVISILLSFFLSFILSKVYKKNSSTISNPESLAKVLPILSIGTTIIIAVVKSSLALSLGLVGALSIVRFRTPIKEPEELTYIFLSIGIGLATGADQFKAAIIGLFMTTFFIYFSNWIDRKKKKNNLLRLSISNIQPKEINSIIELITSNCSRVDFHNLSVSNSEQNNQTSLSLSIIPIDFNKISTITNDLKKNYPLAAVTLLDW